MLPKAKLIRIILSILLIFTIWNCGKSSIRSKKTNKGLSTYKETEETGAEKGYSDLDSDSADELSAEESSFIKPKRKKIKKESYKKSPTKSGLKAGFADDNQQFGYYLSFINRYKNSVAYRHKDIANRIQFQIQSQSGKPLFNQKLQFFNTANQLLEEGRSHSDGHYNFYPSFYNDQTFQIRVADKTHTFQAQGKRKIAITTTGQRNTKPGMDLVFILDTTGSMGEEIQRLKSTIEIIHLNLTQIKNIGELRFGMVLYRDKGDAYRSKTIALTADLNKFQQQLNRVEADGGGDSPEDLEEALRVAAQQIQWRKNAIKLSYVITDATLHQDYQNSTNYLQSCELARQMGLKIHTIGTGGLPLNGEFILRQISQLTAGKYIFLTYGEKGESSGGKASSVSHHTGANFQTDKLESIVIRFARQEIENITGKKNYTQEYYLANQISGETKEETLKQLFTQGIQQLFDYSTYPLAPNSTISIIPIIPIKNKNAEYFSEQILLNLRKNKTVRVIDRNNLQQILKELKLGQQGLVSEKSRIRAGKLIGAATLISGKMYTKKESYELYLKLIRTETGEVLSITKLVIDKRLGL